MRNDLYRNTLHRSIQKKNVPPSSKNTPDFTLLMITLLLVGFGVVMVYSASSSLASVSPTYNQDAFHFAKRQLMWAGLGLIAMFITMNIRYTVYKILFFPLFVITVIMLVLVLCIGEVRNGARSWFGIGSFGVQPTELAKITTIMYVAALIVKKGEKFRDFKKGLLPVILIILFIVTHIMGQPDFGAAIILVLCAGVVVIAGGANLKHIFHISLLALTIGCISFGFSMLVAPEKIMGEYQFARIQSWLDPFYDTQVASYNLLQSLKAIAHGGWFGTGLGESIQKLMYLPNAYNDFIFAVIAEEWGFIGTLIFLLIYLLFIWRGILIALYCSDMYGTLLSIGIVGIISVQALINIGGVTRTIPITGVTLPLISYGGSSLCITMASIGILLSISRQSSPIGNEKRTPSLRKSR